MEGQDGLQCGIGASFRHKPTILKAQLHEHTTAQHIHTTSTSYPTNTTAPYPFHVSQPSYSTLHTSASKPRRATRDAGRGQASYPRTRASIRSSMNTRQHHTPTLSPTPPFYASHSRCALPKLSSSSRVQGRQAKFTLKLALEDDSNLPRGGETHCWVHGRSCCNRRHAFRLQGLARVSFSGQQPPCTNGPRT